MPPTTTRTLNPVPFEHWEPKRFGLGAAAHVGEHNTRPPDSNTRISHGQRHQLDNVPELDEARQGVTGHPVRKVLGWGMIATIVVLPSSL